MNENERKNETFFWKERLLNPAFLEKNLNFKFLSY